MAAHDDDVTPLFRSQLTDAEERYVQKLERRGFIPSDFRRYSDGSLTFAASPAWWKSRAKRPRSMIS